MQAKVYFAIVILSTLVIGGIFAAPIESSGCPLGIPLFACFVDPCRVSTCPADPTAKCVSNYCGGCNAIWSNNLGQVNCELIS